MKFIKIISTASLAFLLAVGLIYTFILAAVQQSYRSCPPTEQELIDYPELREVYDYEWESTS